jgi:hypothetical protein
MAPQVDTNDLIDAQGVADLLGLKYRNHVHAWQARYPDMPRPVVNLGARRPMLWSRKAVERWARATGRIK